ncbi:MAG TPA: glycosyltransferase, partial [Lacibacter sp.]|nr:glycosyltransferase [Lacibacter sp.]
MKGFSVIICSYNPSEYLIDQLLKAVLSFGFESPPFEVIIVDNNSKRPLAEYACVSSLLSQHNNSVLLVEPMPGLTAARLRGISAARYDWLIFFDDDNVPSPDYLHKARSFIEENPQTGVFGPGTVTVDYTTDVKPWLNNFKPLFQERKEPVTVISKSRIWEKCYPYGTGMVVLKKIAEVYKERVDNGRYTLSDRKGRSLSSGGDVQMVLTAVHEGFFAGVVAGLSLVHVIDTEKLTVNYLERQQYGTAAAYVKAYNQVFQESKLAISEVSNWRIFLLIYSLFKLYWTKTSIESFRVLLAKKMGECKSAVYAYDGSLPF